MLTTVVKRLLQGVLVLVMVMVLVFVLLRLIPGDPARQMMSIATEEALEALRAEMGLDKSIPEQLVVYVKNLFQGNLGYSWFQKADVSTVIAQAIPKTALMLALALVSAIIFGFIFGVVAAIITWWVYTMLERMIARVPNDIMNIIFVVIAVFGAIIWSLYLINPPGVDDANLPENKNQPEVVQQRDDTRAVAVKLAAVDNAISELEKAIEQSTELDKTTLKAEAESIRSEAKKMLNEGLGLEKYPTIYDQVLVAVNAHSEQ